MLAVLKFGEMELKSRKVRARLRCLVLFIDFFAYLEVVKGAGCARGQASGGVIARGALLPALIRLSRSGLEGEHLLWTLGAGLVTLLRRLLGNMRKGFKIIRLKITFTT